MTTARTAAATRPKAGVGVQGGNLRAGHQARRCGVAGIWSSTASRTRSGSAVTPSSIHDRTMRVVVAIGAHCEQPPARQVGRRRRAPRAARASRDEVGIGPSLGHAERFGDLRRAAGRGSGAGPPPHDGRWKAGGSRARAGRDRRPSSSHPRPSARRPAGGGGSAPTGGSGGPRRSRRARGAGTTRRRSAPGRAAAGGLARSVSSACCVASSARSMSRRILCATAWSRSPAATARLANASSSPCCARITSSVSMPLPHPAPIEFGAFTRYGRRRRRGDSIFAERPLCAQRMKWRREDLPSGVALGARR